jgi:predicted metalloendopeptidase
MVAKLTLRLDKGIIEKAKEFAKNKNDSLSRMVEKYFKAVLDKKPDEEKKYSPLVEELSGIIHLDEEFYFKEDYTTYLIEKYR